MEALKKRVESSSNHQPRVGNRSMPRSDQGTTSIDHQQEGAEEDQHGEFRLPLKARLPLFIWENSSS